MEESPTSPSTRFVNSPRRTLSLIRERRAKLSFPDPAELKAAPTIQPSSEHGPKPSEVYGFVGSITTVVATAMYLIWAYAPESWLHFLRISYYPNKYWAVVVPAFVMVTIVLAMVFYWGLNFMATPHPTSFNTLFDEFSQEPSKIIVSEGEQPIEPISDLSIAEVNDLMFGLR